MLKPTAILLVVLFCNIFPETISAQTTPPKGTVASNGGLKFSHRLVRENFTGLTPQHGFAASQRPGRVTVETDPSRVRSGKASIKMNLQPKDCGGSPRGGPNDWNDCTAGNERVDVAFYDDVGGSQIYAMSVMLDQNISRLRGQPSYMPSNINLYQWFQLDSGACFNIQYNTRSKKMNIDYRCSGGRYGHGRASIVNLPGPVFDVWHEFVVYAKWSKGNDGSFRVLHNGKLVLNHSGPTLAKKGSETVAEHSFVYRYGNREKPAWAFYPIASTVWFDDMMRSSRIGTIEKKYDFDRTRLGFR